MSEVPLYTVRSDQYDDAEMIPHGVCRMSFLMGFGQIPSKFGVRTISQHERGRARRFVFGPSPVGGSCLGCPICAIFYMCPYHKCPICSILYVPYCLCCLACAMFARRQGGVSMYYMACLVLGHVPQIFYSWRVTSEKSCLSLLRHNSRA